jgi:hypothetical protein
MPEQRMAQAMQYYAKVFALHNGPLTLKFISRSSGRNPAAVPIPVLKVEGLNG